MEHSDYAEEGQLVIASFFIARHFSMETITYGMLPKVACDNCLLKSLVIPVTQQHHAPRDL